MPSPILMQLWLLLWLSEGRFGLNGDGLSTLETDY